MATEREARSEFLRLFVRHEPQVYGFIRSAVPNQADAEDVFQETAVVLWEKFEQYEPGSRFDRWALRIAHNQVLYHRQKAHRNKLTFDAALLDQLAEESAELGGERHEALRGCVEKLAREDRALITQRFAAGASNRSVAVALGWSESTVSRTLSRVYLDLMQCIEMAIGPQRAPKVSRP